MMMNSLDSTMVTVAFATLGREFGRTPDEMQGILIGYLVSMAMFIPASGWLGDRFGTKRIFLLALAIFTTGSLLSGMAQSYEMLVGTRLIQGAGGGLIIPVGMAMLYRTYPPEERVRISRILMFALIIGPACGPLLGGFLVEKFSWHAIFFVNVPVGLTALTFGALFLEEHTESAPGGFDIAGFVLGGFGLASFMFALNQGTRQGWTTPLVLGAAGLGITLLCSFVYVELHRREPMVQLRLFKNKLFGATAVVSFFSSAAFLGILFVTPVFLQEGRGVSPLESGLTTFPEAIGVVCSTQLVARLYPRFGPRRLMVGGMAGLGCVALIMSRLSLEGGPWPVRILMFGLGVCMAYIFLPNQAASLATISKSETGRASTLFSVQRQLGSAIGIAVLGSVMAVVGTTVGGTVGGPPNVDAYHAAYLAAAVMAFVGSLLALRVPDSEASHTMVRQTKVKRSKQAPTVEPVADQTSAGS
ncbi:MAG: DHA2 family efflux MFS transporter permease subunit [Thermomicrobiales bacterium]|nr:MAG: DHA2 family efflux MFS transporter permease subunit [Thermomicrobiales bacterium]